VAVEVTDRRRARHEATKARILAAAWELAAEQGLAGISLRDLAARVDLRQPSLYTYFASKDALYDAMFAQGYAQLLAEVEPMQLAGDPRERIRQMARLFVDLSVSNPVRAQLLFQRTLPGFEPSAESYALAEQFLVLAKERLAKIGVTEPRDLDLYTGVVGGIVSQQMANDPGGDRWARLVDDAMDMYLDFVTGDRKADR
jgi:AcrR family transcriptional regulator